MSSSKSSDAIEVWDGRAHMRTLADALAKLQALGALADRDLAEIRTTLMQLPDGNVAGTVVVFGRTGERSVRVILPVAASFTAKNTIGLRERYEIDRLDGATCDPDGNVRLREGSFVHAVELEKVALTCELTPSQEDISTPSQEDISRPSQETILKCVLHILGVEKQCYRHVHPELLPGVFALDYAAVARLGAEKLPSLKAIERDVRKHLPNVPRQTLANVLALAGLRRPRSGPRARVKTDSPSTATIPP